MFYLVRHHSVRFVIMALALACLASWASFLSYSHSENAKLNLSREASASKEVGARRSDAANLTNGILLPPPVPAPTCVPPPSEMVSWWPGDGNANDIQDGNHGMLQGGATFAPGMVGQTFSFDGVNDTINVPKAPNLDVGDQVTLDFWMKADPGNFMNSCCQGLVTTDFYAIEISGGGDPRVGVNFFVNTGTGFVHTSDANGGGATIAPDEWHHFAGTYDGTLLQLYIDGQPWGAPRFHSGTIAPMLANSFLAIGSEDGRTTCPSCIGNRYFKGLIDEVEVFRRALDASEIQAIFAAGTAGKCKPPPTPTPICVPPPTNMISWWPGEGNAGDIQNSNHGTLQNGATFAPGMVGQAFSFDGVDDLVLIPRNPSLEPSELTLDAWINADNFDGDRYNFIIAKQATGNVGTGDNGGAASYALGVDTQGRPRVHLWNGFAEQQIVSPNSISTGSWYHLAVSIDSTAIRLYVNGLEVASDAMSGSILYNTNPGYDVEIGTYLRQHGPAFAFDGLIDEVEIFNRALTASEIQAIFNAGSAGKCKPAPTPTPSPSPTPPQADLSITKTASPSGSVATSSQITYTITVNNAGPSAASNVNVNDSIPPGTTFSSFTTSQGSCTAPLPGTSNPPLNCSLGSLAANSSATITLKVDVTALPGATISNTATVMSDTFDPTPNDHSATATNSVAGCDLVVRNTNDSGAHSLRLAIQCANANLGLDTITFNIPGGGAHTIQPTSPLPAITDPVVIDGYTQPGTSANALANGDNAVLLIEIDGTSAGGVTDGLTVETTGAGSTLRGLVINRFGNAGISLNGGGNHVEGNFLGTNTTGTAALGNTSGVVLNNSANNTVGGTASNARNVISGNRNSGVQIQFGSSNNLVQGNFIGLDVNGNNALGNGINGINVVINNAANNTVGGTASGARNMISGDTNHDGVNINGSGSTGNVVQGNFIGTDVTGTIARPNYDGVTLSNGAFNNTVGGTSVGAGNVISGNNHFGINIQSGGNLVQGNFIGTNASGTAAVGNVFGGVWINGTSGNTIGGTSPGAGNVISGNRSGGITITTTGNLVQGNLIGTNAAGTAALGNLSHGVAILGAPGNTIGGTSSGAGNVLSGNVNGIFIGGDTATGNFVQGNFIGTNATGTAAFGNSANGVQLSGAPANTIGGTSSGAGNVISGNQQNGVQINSNTATGNLVQGNLIGTKANGADPLPNTRGVNISGASNNTVGPANTIVGASAGVTVSNFPAGSISDIHIIGNTSITGGTGSNGVEVMGGNFSSIDINNNGPIQGGDTGVRISANNQNGPASISGVSVNGNSSITGGTGGSRHGGVDIGASGTNAPASIRDVTVNGNGPISTTGVGTGVSVNSPSNTNISVDGNTSIAGNLSGVGINGPQFTPVSSTNISVSNNQSITGGTGSSGLGVGIGSNTSSVTHTTVKVNGNGTIYGGFRGVGIGTTTNTGPNITVNHDDIEVMNNGFISADAPNSAGILVGSCGAPFCSATNSNIKIKDNGSINTNGVGINGIQVGGCGASGCSSTNSNIAIDHNGFAGGVRGAGRGIQLSSNGSSTTFSDVSITNNVVVVGSVLASRGINFMAISKPGHPNVISGNDVSGAKELGISLVAPNGATTASSNNVHDNPGAGVASFVAGLTGTGATIISNSIHNNGADGVDVYADSPTGNTGNRISQNSIFSNGGLGIDLVIGNGDPDGVTPNDACDPDTGANNLQNFPVLTSVSSSGGATSIQGTLNSTPNTTFTLEFFANDAGDSSGFGEGQAFIGSATVITDGNCNASFTFTTLIPFSGQFITATATDPRGNTSEFSACGLVNADLSIDKTASPNPVATGSDLTYTLVVNYAGPAPATNVTVTDNLPSQTAFKSISAPAGWICATPAVGSNGSVTCTRPSMAPSESATITIVATVDCSVADGTQISDFATVSSLTTDSNPSNNSSTAAVTASNPPPVINCPPDRTVFQDSAFGATVNYPAPTVTDNDSCPVVTSCTPASGSVFPLGTTTVTCVATDSGGKTASCTFKVTVVPPTSTVGVKSTDGGFIQIPGGIGTFGIVAMASSTGFVKGDVEYQDHVTGMNLKSTMITAIVVTGTHARIFGTATINGSGSYDFVVDVDDLGEPGIGFDKFGIQVSNGYTAGPSKLSGGNIQIH